jgi:DNA (cytosine-5)-methyltransferase 1
VIDTTQITSRLNRSHPQPGDPCHTLAENAHPPLLVAPSVRRLTPIECERLQGFPDGFTCLCGAGLDWRACACPDSPRYRALGNAVTVPVIEWLAAQLLRA